MNLIRTYANAQNWDMRARKAASMAGFHYRFSTRVGTDMGRQIGEYVVKNVMQPTIVVGSQ